MQMDLEVSASAEWPSLATEPVDKVEIDFLPGAVSPGRAGWLVDVRDGNSVVALGRLLAAGVEVRRVPKATEVAGRNFPTGAFWIPAAPGLEQSLGDLATGLGVTFVGSAEAPAGDTPRIDMPRVGLFVPWGGDMETGWTQWVLEQWEIPFQEVFGARLEAGGLRDEFDVLIVHAGLPSASARNRRDDALRRGRRAGVDADDLAKLREALPPFEDWSTLEERAVRPSVESAIPALREFVEGGGTLLALGDQVERVIDHLELPVRAGLRLPGEDGGDRPARRDEFFIPGSLLWVDVDVDDSLCYGMSRRQAVVFRGGSVLEVTDPERATVPIRYVGDMRPLASGWAIGDEHLRRTAAVVRVSLGAGEVVLYGLDAIFRGQPTGTFKAVFNAILDAGTR
jgi:hypothetical protein